MTPGRIEGATRRIGPPKGWDKAKEGPCGNLLVRDMPTASGNVMVTAWLPNTDELARMVAGASVYLTVLGSQHPVVAMGVGNAPE